MTIVCNLLLWLFVILNSIESSSQSKRSTDDHHYPSGSQQPAEPTTRSRPRSSILKRTFPGILGFKFEDLAFIRLRPLCKPDRVFELRVYDFPPDKPIKLRSNNQDQSALPTGEKIVLSTSNGDVCAVLDKTPCKHTVLRALCKLGPKRQRRVKINMNSGEVKMMTEDEIAECPVFTSEPVPKNYEVFRLHPPFAPGSSPSASSSTPAEAPIRERSRSPTLRQTFSNVLGYEFKDLESIRLVPHNYPHRIFELRIYDFPRDKPIMMRTTHRVLNPIPTGDQIVLSTSNGDVCAILLKLDKKHSRLHSILTSVSGVVKRVKINISSGTFVELTTEESAECPAPSGEPITKNYRVFTV